MQIPEEDPLLGQEVCLNLDPELHYDQIESAPQDHSPTKSASQDTQESPPTESAPQDYPTKEDVRQDTPWA